MNKIQILGKEITVKWDDSLEDNGTNNPDRYLIKLNPKFKDTAQSTLLHEMIHQALYISGVNEFLTEKQEEAVCMALEHALVDHVFLQLPE